MTDGALSTRHLNKCDWLAISWYINIYQLMNINVSSNNLFCTNDFHNEKILFEPFI